MAGKKGGREAAGKRRTPTRSMSVERDELARRIVGSAHALSLATPDRLLASEALEVIKLATIAMLGERLPPRDCLRRLDAVLGPKGSPVEHRKADYRALVEIASRHAAWVLQCHDGTPLPDYPGASTPAIGREAPLLRRALRERFGREFRALTAAHCAEALRGLLRKHRHGKRSVHGAAVDLIVSCGAWGGSEAARQDLQTAVAGACRAR